VSSGFGVTAGEAESGATNGPFGSSMLPAWPAWPVRWGDIAISSGGDVMTAGAFADAAETSFDILVLGTAECDARVATSQTYVTPPNDDRIASNLISPASHGWDESGRYPRYLLVYDISGRPAG